MKTRYHGKRGESLAAASGSGFMADEAQCEQPVPAAAGDGWARACSIA